MISNHYDNHFCDRRHLIVARRAHQVWLSYDVKLGVNRRCLFLVEERKRERERTAGRSWCGLLMQRHSCCKRSHLFNITNANHTSGFLFRLLEQKKKKTCESIEVGKDQTHRLSCGLPLHPKWLPRSITFDYQCGAGK